MDKLNYYEILGVKEDASSEEIKIAYKNQIKKWHPDINHSSDASLMTTKLNEAKKVLLNETERRNYDILLEENRQKNYDNVLNRDKRSTRDRNQNDFNKEYIGKWEYLKEWLRYADVSKTRKFFGVLGIALETAICKLIVLMLYFISFMCVVATIVINFVFTMFGGFTTILLFLIFLSYWFNKMSFESLSVSSMGISLLLFIGVILVFRYLPSLLLSPVVFDFLYNRLDIYLFKICVGYTE